MKFLNSLVNALTGSSIEPTNNPKSHISDQDRMGPGTTYTNNIINCDSPAEALSLVLMNPGDVGAGLCPIQNFDGVTFDLTKSSRMLDLHGDPTSQRFIDLFHEQITHFQTGGVIQFNSESARSNFIDSHLKIISLFKGVHRMDPNSEHFNEKINVDFRLSQGNLSQERLAPDLIPHRDIGLTVRGIIRWANAGSHGSSTVLIPDRAFNQQQLDNLMLGPIPDSYRDFYHDNRDRLLREAKLSPQDFETWRNGLMTFPDLAVTVKENQFVVISQNSESGVIHCAPWRKTPNLGMFVAPE